MRMRNQIKKNDHRTNGKKDEITVGDSETLYIGKWDWERTKKYDWFPNIEKSTQKNTRRQHIY